MHIHLVTHIWFNFLQTWNFNKPIKITCLTGTPYPSVYSYTLMHIYIHILYIPTIMYKHVYIQIYTHDIHIQIKVRDTIR